MNSLHENKLFDGVLIVGLREEEDASGSLVALVPEIQYAFPPLKHLGGEEEKVLSTKRRKKKKKERNKNDDDKASNAEGGGKSEEGDQEKIVENNEDNKDKEEKKNDTQENEEDKDHNNDKEKEDKGKEKDDEIKTEEGEENVQSVRNRRQSVMMMDVDIASLSNDATLLEQIREFCFPDISSFITILPPKKNKPSSSITSTDSPDKKKHKRWKIKKKCLEERFSFVLTASSGERRWGYCARMVPTPPSGKPMLPVCFCILSFIPCFRIYSKILDSLMEFQKYRPGNYCSCDIFLKSIYKHPPPPPGGTLEVRMTGLDTCYSFSRPDDMDSLLDHVSFEQLLTKMDGYSIVAVFVSLLVERRIIFIADNLATLSATTQAAMALLYPFSWQHIFVPVLPPSLLHFCCAPMPFVCGILRSSVPLLKKYSASMEAIILVDIDNNEVIFPASFQTQGGSSLDYDLVPPSCAKELIDAIEAVTKLVKGKKKPFIKRPSLAVMSKESSQAKAKAKAEKQDSEEQIANAVKKDLANAFIGFMVDSLSSYRMFLIPKGRKKEGLMDISENWCFDKNGFIEKQPEEFRPLLRLIVQSQMFAVFLNLRSSSMPEGGHRRSVNLRNAGLRFNGKFEKRLTMHLKKGPLVRENSKGSLDSKWLAPRSRFTMYENGTISRKEITKRFTEMEEEEKLKEQGLGLKKVTSAPEGLTREPRKSSAPALGGSAISKKDLLRRSLRLRRRRSTEIELSRPQNFQHVSHIGNEAVNNSIISVLELLCNPTGGGGGPSMSSNVKNISPLPPPPSSLATPTTTTTTTTTPTTPATSLSLLPPPKPPSPRAPLTPGRVKRPKRKRKKRPTGRSGATTSESETEANENGFDPLTQHLSLRKRRPRGILPPLPATPINGDNKTPTAGSPRTQNGTTEDRDKEKEGKENEKERQKEKESEKPNDAISTAATTQKEPEKPATTVTTTTTTQNEKEKEKKKEEAREKETTTTPTTTTTKKGEDNRLAEFCAGLGLSELVAIFEAEDVTYADLFLLSEEDLAALNIKMGPRKRILNAIKNNA